MIEEYSIGIFPPVYAVEMIGKEISDLLKNSKSGYKQNYKVSKLFGSYVEFIPSNSCQSDSGTITVVGCLNPDKVTNLATKDCTMVLFKTPKETELLNSFQNKYQGTLFTVKSYISQIEKEYKTTLNVGNDFKRIDVSNWLEFLNTKCLMLLRMTSLKLWDYTVDSCENEFQETTDYMIEFVKTLNIDGEIYHANLGWYITEDEDGRSIQRLHSLASAKEIEATEGRCLRVNYNRKRFLTDLSYLTEVTEMELFRLDSFGDALIEYNFPEEKEESVVLFNIMH